MSEKYLGELKNAPLRAPKDLMKDLKDDAKKRRMSRNSLILDILVHYLNNKKD